ncbi:MAG: hypothetical protein PW789_16870 [Edaphobacter sp.]|uniref:hypothetical protein n=1 Tax=Edaphobacter sp. TaxID=1934404 RepID=UPI00238938A0|nr:hypothetical protein [Edaphobacter sp.]MDE1178249.1 hypothetical protein [Edaphobacter sp.]
MLSAGHAGTKITASAAGADGYFRIFQMRQAHTESLCPHLHLQANSLRRKIRAETPTKGEFAMPKYQMLFDTVRAEQKFNVDIDEQETLDATLDEILFELRERGDYLKGEGQPQVVWNGASLDFSIPLPQQGVRGNDILRVSTIVLNG